MSKEKITIRSFAGIENAAIEVHRFTVLIGPQASGKSVTAKLLYFFRGIWQNLLYAPEADFSIDAQKETAKEQFRRYFPPETWGGSVFVIEYEVGGHKVMLRRAPSRGKPSDGLILSLPSFVDELVSKVKQQLDGEDKKPRAYTASYKRWEVWQSLAPDLLKALGDRYFESQLFVPAGRAFFSNIESNVFSFIARSERKLDPFLAEFGEYFSWVKSASMRRASRREFATPLSNGLLGGALVVEKDREYVKTKDGRSLPLATLSSGQQEALPLLMMLEDIGDDPVARRRGGSGVQHASYIEEPEAHLFPDFQRRIIEKVVENASSGRNRHSLFITTHSPYVLAALNNMLFAGKVGAGKSKERRDAVATVVPQSLWISASDLSVYAFTKDGVRALIDKDLGLIDAEYIDSASTQIASIFDELLSVSALSARKGVQNVHGEN